MAYHLDTTFAGHPEYLLSNLLNLLVSRILALFRDVNGCSHRLLYWHGRVNFEYAPDVVVNVIFY